jgi:glyoxylase-like metal-dependent hydrolase (beta-lactamase superfamily II)
MTLDPRLSPQSSSLYLKQLSVGPMENFQYLAGDKASKECFAVDPGWDADAAIEAAQKDGMKITGVLLTHTHYDHANAVEALIRKTGGKIYVHQAESGFLKGDRYPIVKTRDGDEISIGTVKIVCLHTPGHTPGSQCFLVSDGILPEAPKYLLTGDTLFIGACGRCDFEGSDPKEMYASLQKLARLGDDVIVLPGHFYSDEPASTIGNEKKTNPYYRCRTLEDFLHNRMGM